MKQKIGMFNGIRNLAAFRSHLLIKLDSLQKNMYMQITFIKCCNVTFGINFHMCFECHRWYKMSATVFYKFWNKILFLIYYTVKGICNAILFFLENRDSKKLFMGCQKQKFMYTTHVAQNFLCNCNPISDWIQ